MKVKKYRTHELLDTIFTSVYPQEVWANDVRNVRKMYKACDALLNAHERPAEAYEKAMTTFEKCLKKYVAEMNTLTQRTINDSLRREIAELKKEMDEWLQQEYLDDMHDDPQFIDVLPETITDPKWVEFWNNRTKDENGEWQYYEDYYRDEWENNKLTQHETADEWNNRNRIS